MPRITWSEVNRSLGCDELRALRERIYKEFTDFGSSMDVAEIAKKYRDAVQPIEQKILPPAREVQLIARWQDTTLPKAQRDAAKKRLDDNLELMKQRLKLLEDSWYLQDLVKMKDILNCYIQDKCLGKPTFTSPTYPAVKDDPWKFVKLILGGG